MKIENRIREELERRKAVVNEINPAISGGENWDEYIHEMGVIGALISLSEWLKSDECTEKMRANIEKTLNYILQAEGGEENGAE